MNSQWELIDNDTSDPDVSCLTKRRIVPGGWLYCVTYECPQGQDSRQTLVQLAFVPEPDHGGGKEAPTKTKKRIF